jgi:hypothetical protein
MGRSTTVEIEYKDIELEVEIEYDLGTSGCWINPPEPGYCNLISVMHEGKYIDEIISAKDINEIENRAWEWIIENH